MHDEYPSAQPTTIHHPVFARLYAWLLRGWADRATLRSFRQETAGKAAGVVLEVGAGSGLNFSSYRPEQVERVEATEPDATMLRYAHRSLKDARVPIQLSRAPAEHLPFAAATFDSAVVTLVFCSVADPQAGLREIKRVLKPGGTLYLLEHVRSRHVLVAWIQRAITPLSRALSGNCHWNRETARTLTAAGFTLTKRREFSLLLIPMLLVEATYHEEEERGRRNVRANGRPHFSYPF